MYRRKFRCFNENENRFKRFFFFKSKYKISIDMVEKNVTLQSETVAKKRLLCFVPDGNLKKDLFLCQKLI